MFYFTSCVGFCPRPHCALAEFYSPFKIFRGRLWLHVLVFTYYVTIKRLLLCVMRRDQLCRLLTFKPVTTRDLWPVTRDLSLNEVRSAWRLHWVWCQMWHRRRRKSRYLAFCFTARRTRKRRKKYAQTREIISYIFTWLCSCCPYYLLYYIVLLAGVCRRRMSSYVTLPAGGPAGRRARGSSGGRHCTAGQSCCVQLGRHLVFFKRLLSTLNIAN